MNANVLLLFDFNADVVNCGCLGDVTMPGMKYLPIDIFYEIYQVFIRNMRSDLFI